MDIERLKAKWCFAYGDIGHLILCLNDAYYCDEMRSLGLDDGLVIEEGYEFAGYDPYVVEKDSNEAPEGLVSVENGRSRTERDQAALHNVEVVRGLLNEDGPDDIGDRRDTKMHDHAGTHPYS
ncbi:MAG: hypothetical protein AAF413_02580 [Patescibacteria group bacterium]